MCEGFLQEYRYSGNYSSRVECLYSTCRSVVLTRVLILNPIISPQPIFVTSTHVQITHDVSPHHTLRSLPPHTRPKFHQLNHKHHSDLHILHPPFQHHILNPRKHSQLHSSYLPSPSLYQIPLKPHLDSQSLIELRIRLSV